MIFQEDINKPSSFDVEADLENSTSLDKLIVLTKYKEELMKNNCSIHLLKELMTLYQKIIEIYSARNDPQFEEYLKKLHNLLNSKKMEDSLEIGTNYK